MAPLGHIRNMQLAAVAVTRLPNHHFFGYYTNEQFDLSERYLLGLQCGIIGRLQRAEDIATLGIVDLDEAYTWRPLANTAAWNWQMGCMARWLPGKPHQIIYNDRREGRLISIIRDVASNDERILPDPVFEVAPDGKSALTLNFSRLWDVRPETGYPGVKDPWSHQSAPDEDGIFRLDLDTGKTTQIISHADMAEFPPTMEMPRNAKRYFTHLLFNKDGTRFIFWYRCHCPQGGYYSGLYTASPDGGAISLVTRRNSHAVWCGRDTILAWSAPDNKAPRTWLFTDQTNHAEVMGDGCLDFNGHATFSPDGKWLVTDMAPDQRNERVLALYEVAGKRRIDIGRFHSMPELGGELRCDLHPRWNRTGTQVCIDSTHEGSRQMYLVDVHEIVAGAGMGTSER